MPQELFERLQSGHQGLGSEVSFGSRIKVDRQKVTSAAPNPWPRFFQLRYEQRPNTWPLIRYREMAIL